MLYILLNIDKDKYLLCINHENKLMPALEKLSKDQNKYVTSCLNHLLVFLADQFVHFIELIENELTLQAQQKTTEEQYTSRNNLRNRSALKGNLVLLNYVF